MEIQIIGGSYDARLRQSDITHWRQETRLISSLPYRHDHRSSGPTGFHGVVAEALIESHV
jgi:hypothetical protein